MRNLSEEEYQNWKIHKNHKLHHHPFLSDNDKTILCRSHTISHRKTEAQISELINFVAVMPKASISHTS